MVKLISQLHKNICKKPFCFGWINPCCATHPLPLDYPLQVHLHHRNMSLPPIHHNFFYSLCDNINTLMEMHAHLIVQGLTRDLSCSTKLVSLYGSLGRLDFARSVFDTIPDPDFLSWKVIIRWYFLNSEFRHIMGFYNRMRMCLKECDNIVFSHVLKACSESRDFDAGRKVHCQIVKFGTPDSFVFTGLVDMYAKCGEIERSRSVFDEILDRNVFSWSSMIAGYVQNNFAQDGLVLFNRMREELIEANQITLGILVDACKKIGALHQGKWLHGYLIKYGIELGSYLLTALLDMYAKCGVVRDARSVFDELHDIDVVSWTAMIVGYTQNGCPEEALKLFLQKEQVDVLPNDVTIASVFSACSQLLNLNLGRSIHGLSIKLGSRDPVVTNSLVDFYAKCQMNRDARYIFETVSDRDVVAWNSIIYGFSQNGSAYEALELFHLMRMGSVLPDSVTFVSVLSACASLNALQVGSSFHAYTVKSGLLSSNIYVGTALLTFYAKCGDAESARIIFDGMDQKSTVTWSAMISGYGIQGNGCGSLSIFSDMLKAQLKPNEEIFTSILSACSHTGMVGEGWKLFTMICQDYNLVPSMRHYTCMVDLLARAGRLKEALDFLQKMPVQPDVSLFGAFLHGCGLHSRFDLGELAIKRMLELHPGEACYYVLICNLYASDGRWSKVKQVREFMKKRELMKTPGCSLMEMDVDHDFSFSRAASHA
ncbi:PENTATRICOPEPTIDE REPEAT-CONTAINING PROTEIN MITOCHONDRIAL [Salix viminalis]|uniref:PENTATRICOPEPTIDE REPEAT-CONTAINING PROTEIN MITOCHONDRIAL n=2 Tax=Salix viminalis TaxID=40686 RepID=A0A9Q0TZW3_SALVM|nr:PENTATRICOPEPTIDE REPEAT-CONTAINING PROTEIN MITOCHONDRIAL [Salix viminalis]